MSPQSEPIPPTAPAIGPATVRRILADVRRMERAAGRPAVDKTRFRDQAHIPGCWCYGCMRPGTKGRR